MLYLTSFSLSLSMLASNLDNSTEKPLQNSIEKQVPEKCDLSWVLLIVTPNCQLNEIIVLQIFAVTLLWFQDVDGVQG